MQTIDRAPQQGLWQEEMNRARMQIQSRWSEAERSHRRQLAECKQQAFYRVLALMPIDRSRPPVGDELK
jgi:hypothetical protein